MSDQNKESQASKTATLHISEEKQAQAIAKIKELFEKENFRKNTALTGSIINNTNTIHYQSLFKDKTIQELNLDQITFQEILKNEELKAIITYNPTDFTITPNWRRLRNILYINNIDRDLKAELQELIEKDIKEITSEYKLEYFIQNDNIKITVTAANQEETLTKDLFDKIFLKPYKVGDKEFSFACVIEEEQFNLPSTPNYQQHTFKPNNLYPAMYEHRQYNNFVQYQQLLMMQQKQAAEFQRQQFSRGGKPNRNPKQHQNNQFVHKNGAQFGNNTKSAGNNLHQPSSHPKQQNNKGGQIKNKFNKGFTKTGGNKSQRVFNPNENDFPTLQ